jgi:small subunit ribosomal protein S15
MALLKEKKEEIIKKFSRGNADTGSSEVQIALLTARINELTTHFNTFNLIFYLLMILCEPGFVH